MTPNSDGPDISHYQKVTNWDAIPQYRLFSTKATESYSYTDPTFDVYWEQMRRRKFEFRGCYHWIRSTATPASQIAKLKQVLSAHGGLQVGEFIQLDWETTPNVADVSVAQITEWLRLAEIEWPGRIIVYSSDWVPGFTTWRAKNPTYPVWYANYNTGSTASGGWAESTKYNASIWQWTSTATIPGIVGGCDQNNVLQWETLRRITATIAQPLTPDKPAPPVEDKPMPARYIATPPPERPGAPWFLKFDGAVSYATNGDDGYPTVPLNAEQYDNLHRSVFGDAVTKVEVTNWPAPVAGGAQPFPASFTITGDIVAQS